VQDVAAERRVTRDHAAQDPECVRRQAVAGQTVAVSEAAHIVAPAVAPAVHDPPLAPLPHNGISPETGFQLRAHLSIAADQVSICIRMVAPQQLDHLAAVLIELHAGHDAYAVAEFLALAVRGPQTIHGVVPIAVERAQQRRVRSRWLSRNAMIRTR